MATLADTGATDVNENNPYQLAMGNKVQQGMAGKGGGVSQELPSRVPAQLAPAGVAYQNSLAGSSTPNPSPLIGTAAVKDIDADAPVADDSTEDTPEARPADQKKQQGAANLQNLNHTLDPSATKATKLPTEQQDVNAALAPDQAVLAGLPDEYKSALASLAPYINSGQDTGNAALNAADAEVANVTNDSEGGVEKALGGLAKAGKEYESTVPYSGIVQALLGQSKYNITYNNAQPGNHADWNDTMNDIYAYLSGTNASADGLPTPTAAAATAPAPASTNDSAGGGNA